MQLFAFCLKFFALRKFKLLKKNHLKKKKISQTLPFKVINVVKTRR